MRRVKVLHEGVHYDEIMPIHIHECDMVADGFTKYIPMAVWRRHIYYLLNLGIDYPPGKRATPRLTSPIRTPTSRRSDGRACQSLPKGG